MIHQSGYVIISDVFKLPTEKGWWEMLKDDVEKLRGTNNCVPIFNGSKKNDFSRCQFRVSPPTSALTHTLCIYTHSHTTYTHRFEVSKKFKGCGPAKKSDPIVLARVETFLNKWFQQMAEQVRRLGLLAPPRTKGEDKLIVSFPPCKMQKLHWDFDPDVVQGLIQAKKYEGIPISTIASFSPNG